MEVGKLGFGMMRLPVKGGDPEQIDFETLDGMVEIGRASCRERV